MKTTAQTKPKKMHFRLSFYGYMRGYHPNLKLFIVLVRPNETVRQAITRTLNTLDSVISNTSTPNHAHQFKAHTKRYDALLSYLNNYL